MIIYAILHNGLDTFHDWLKTSDSQVSSIALVSVSFINFDAYHMNSYTVC